MRRLSVISFLTLVLMTCACSLALGQAVPAPAPFHSAQTVFVGSGGGADFLNRDKLNTSMAYQTLVQQLTLGKRYTVSPTPAGTDLLFEVSLPFTAGTVFSGSSSGAAAVLRLVIRDTKTNALIWTLSEPIKATFREKDFQHSVDLSVALLIADLKLLDAGTLPTDDSKDPNKAH